MTVRHIQLILTKPELWSLEKKTYFFPTFSWDYSDHYLAVKLETLFVKGKVRYEAQALLQKPLQRGDRIVPDLVVGRLDGGAVVHGRLAPEAREALLVVHRPLRAHALNFEYLQKTLSESTIVLHPMHEKRVFFSKKVRDLLS